jgi:F-type H+-transporting ATPase subunit b
MKRSIRFVVLALSLALAAPAAFAQHENHEAPAEVGVGEHGGGHAVSEGFHAPETHFNLSTPFPAAEGGHPAPPPFLWGPVLNFLLLVVVLYMAVTRQVNPALAARRAAVETEINEAKRLHDEAKVLHQEYTDRLEHLEAEMNTLKADFVKQGEAERDRIIAEAEERAEKMRSEGAQMIEQEVRAMREELRREVVVAAASAAEESLKKAVTPADQHRLVDDFVQMLERDAVARTTKGASA